MYPHYRMGGKANLVSLYVVCTRSWRDGARGITTIPGIQKEPATKKPVNQKPHG